ncbi:MAG: NAD(P)H-dependent oxidoreductase [Parapedobacter sp.]|nr:MAG: NAD(P)H-dependent oxidoreductase [Parapedobacter sp.]
MRQILAINGSASQNSSNRKLIDIFVGLTNGFFDVTVFDNLKALPHFEPERALDDTPKAVLDFRELIEKAEGILICTPEYVFSIPSGLKNAMEWCVSTTVFSGKPTGLITASANGEKGHAELQLIMQTLMAVFIRETTLLIKGIKEKINDQNTIVDRKIEDSLTVFIDAFRNLTVSRSSEHRKQVDVSGGRDKYLC